MKDFKPSLLKKSFFENIISGFKDKINNETDYIESKIDEIKKQLDAYKYDYISKLIFHQNRVCNNLQISQLVNEKLEHEFEKSIYLPLDQIKMLYYLIQDGEALKKIFDINISKYNKEFMETIKLKLSKFTKEEDLMQLENKENLEHELRDKKGKLFLKMENVINKSGLYDAFVVFEKADGKKYLAYIENDDNTIKIREIINKNNLIFAANKSLTLKGHSAEIITIKHTRIGKKDYLITIADDNNCNIWELLKFKLKLSIPMDKAESKLIDVVHLNNKDKNYIAVVIMKKDTPIQIFDFFNGDQVCELNINGVGIHINSTYFNNKAYLLVSSKNPCQIALYDISSNYSAVWRINMENKVTNSIIYNDAERPIIIFKDESSEMFKLELLTGSILMQQHIFGCGNLVKLTDNYFIKSVFNSLEIVNKNDWKIVKRYEDIHPTTIANLVVFNYGSLGIILFYKGIDNTMNYFQ